MKLPAFIFFLLGALNVSAYQDSLLAAEWRGKALTAQDQGLFEQALEHQTLASRIYQSSDDLINWLGLRVDMAKSCFRKHGLPLQSIQIIQQAIDQKWREPETAAEWKKLAWAYANLAYVRKQFLGDYRGAKTDYEQALHIFEKVLKRPDDVQAAAFIRLPIGNLYTRTGDYPKAIFYLEKAWNIGRQTNNASLLANAANDLGLAYRWAGNLEASRQAYLAGTQLPGLPAVDKCQLEANLCELAILTGDLGGANRHFRHAITALKSVEYERDREEWNLATLSLKARLEWEEGKNARQTLEQWKQATYAFYPDPNRREVGKMHLEFGQYLNHTGQYQQALEHFQAALERVLPNFRPPAHFANPEPGLLYAENTIAEALAEKAKTLETIYRKNNDPKLLPLAIECYELMFLVWKKLRETYQYQSSHLNILGENRTYLEKAISLSYIAWEKTSDETYLHRAFHFSELGKNMLLWEKMNHSIKNMEGTMPDSLLDRAHDIKIKIAYFEKQIFQEKNNAENADGEKIREYENELFELKKEQKKLQDILSKKYPEYARLKNEAKLADIVEVQENVLPGAMLIHYFVGDENIFAFLISRNKIEVKKWKKSFPLEQYVADMRDGILGYHILPENLRSENIYTGSCQKYVDNAHLIFQHIITPLGELPERIYIVPDGVLGYIPFEILLTEMPEVKTSFRTHDYLIKKHEISYCPSATLWLDMKNKKAGGKGLLAVAPEFSGENKFIADAHSEYAAEYRRGNLGPLPHNKKEAEYIIEYMGGEMLTGSAATRHNFLEKAPHKSILHLATHAKVDDRDNNFSYLAFGNSPDEKLFLNDLYLHQFPVDMVVLSACETGFGKLHRGEGIMSLSRGFTEAGAKSIVTSLWEVSDRPTSEVMREFYADMSAGKNKSKALRSAQLFYLDKQLEERAAHPFFWASFVAVGDMSPVVSEGVFSWWWVVGVFVLIFLVLWRFDKF